MRVKLIKYIGAFLLFHFFNNTLLVAQVRLPAIIRDSMVLQRDTKIKLWGWAKPAENINISFNHKKYTTVTNENGRWEKEIPSMKAGGPYTITIDASNHIIIHDVMFGDVWLCSGQSNMVHQLSLHSERYSEEIKNANFPEIRQFWIPTEARLTSAQADLPISYWKSANPKDVLDFSAIAYFFAKDLYLKYHIPIGLINASVGGTPIEAWTSEDGLKEFPDILKTIERNKDTGYVNSKNRRAFNLAPKISDRQLDKGLIEPVKWYDTNYVPKNWHNIAIPGYWDDQGVKGLHGVVWYRREIDVPVTMIGIPALLRMGRIVDADNVYINGKLVGNTTYMYPQRRYHLNSTVLHPGKNSIVIRVTNNSGKGGFVPDKPYRLEAGEQSIDLKGYWSYKVGEVFKNTIHEYPISAQNQPSSLFNGMISPIIDFTIKGVLWYQGESNTGNAKQYKQLLPALIQDWRNKWKNDQLPFLYVQLPNFMEMQYSPSESDWALLREAQLQTLSVPNTGMAVAIDLGEWNDVHPDRKKDVGDRLALVAKKLVYGDNKIVASGPIYKSYSIEGNKLRLEFDHLGSGLISNDDEPLSQFSIAGKDRKFVWANAKIEGNTVVVWSDEVIDPKYVRYAWADNPDGANLYNKEGLPASPFRTDQ
jgi:sialate O-acetylesterase